MLDKNNKLLDENELPESERMSNEVKGSGCGRTICIFISLVLFVFALPWINGWYRGVGLLNGNRLLGCDRIDCNGTIGFIGLFWMVLAILFFGIGIRKNK
jgi:hypothetical protein